MKKLKIFYDIDTQNDFMNKDGALYVPDAELIKPNLKLLTDYARKNHIVVIGSVDRHFGTPEYKHQEQELKIWGGPFPNHCMDGTPGQIKIPETTLAPAQGIAADWLTANGNDFGVYIYHMIYHGYPREPIPGAIREVWKDPEELKAVWEENLKGIDEGLLDLALARIEKVKQRKNTPEGIYFEKQHYDIFTNPNAEELLRRANVKEAFVYGVATDYCVKAAVLGMQQRGIQCFVVEDAIKGVFPESTKTALEEITRAGAKLITTNNVLEGRL